MRTLPPLSIVAAVLALPFAPVAMGGHPAGPSDSGPLVGQLAPAHGFRSWLQGEPRTLEELRGRVVVLHTFAWNCVSCLREGIPLSVDLQKAWPGEDLVVQSITTPAMPEETREVVRRLGMEQAVALVNPFDSGTPYVDLRNGITYMWVIGRNGTLVWRGDPSRDEEECLEAIRDAIVDRSRRPLEREVPVELATAAGAFADGRAHEARKEAERVRKRYARKKGDEARAIAEGAEWLLGKIDSRRSELVERLREAVRNGDAAEFVGVRSELSDGYGKDDEARAALDESEAALDEPAFERAVAAELEWRELERERPVLFGVHEDRDAKRFRRRLEAFLEEFDAGRLAELARRLLAA